MTFPTKLTVLRIILTFVIVTLVFIPGLAARVAALVCFVLAGLTDWLDGWVARRWNQTSPLGALLDPIADKLLVLGVFLAFVQLDIVPAWMVLVILVRELVVTGVRLFAASRQVVIAAAKEGKHKLVSQVVAILVILLVLVVREAAGPSGLSPAVEALLAQLILALMWLVVVLTVISGSTFFLKNRHLLWEAVSR